MTSMFDDGFDAKDAAILGGVIGFAEESMREEDRELEEEIEEIFPDEEPSKNASLAAFRRSNPELYHKILRIAINQRITWAQERRDYEEVKDELIAMERCEALLGEE